jgi:hypothetical protein
MEPPAFAAGAAGLWVFNRPMNFGIEESVAGDCLKGDR